MFRIDYTRPHYEYLNIHREYIRIIIMLIFKKIRIQVGFFKISWTNFKIMNDNNPQSEIHRKKITYFVKKWSLRVEINCYDTYKSLISRYLRTLNLKVMSNNNNNQILKKEIITIIIETIKVQYDILFILAWTYF